MTSIASDLRAELLSTLRPGDIMELDYDVLRDSKSRNPNKHLTRAVRCAEDYTSKGIASATGAEAGKDMKENDVAGSGAADFENSLSDLKI